ncbi:hypothetical protein BV22DRAFT_594195 [Leucogyrophana mollusca]|uniref:Uncharacterized protein n=1 Tax=Leucogyrophana mollusca TaxID=85980 RepID=A0ACB8BC95_9AGAM|nr:hypothetical protein BV22DRAFT_594195 [Leucogyrophana mollusca]
MNALRGSGQSRFVTTYGFFVVASSASPTLAHDIAYEGYTGNSRNSLQCPTAVTERNLARNPTSLPFLVSIHGTPCVRPTLESKLRGLLQIYKLAYKMVIVRPQSPRPLTPHSVF